MDSLVWGEFVLLLLLMTFIGLINIPIARSRGRSQVRWFFLGFLLGPLGFVLLLFIPKTQAKKDEEAFDRGELRKCPSCAELVKSETVKCRHCGDPLNIEKLPQQPVGALESGELGSASHVSEL